jgi:hypothetical protein
MGAVITKPVVVEVPTGRDIILVVEGKPVVYIRHNETREGKDLLGASYAKHEYVGMGITVKNDDNYNYQFVGECANTMALEIAEQTIDGVVDGIYNRYYAKKN